MMTAPLKAREVVRRFKAFRKRQLLTQAELGSLIGISRYSVCQIENRKSFPRYSTLRRFNLLEEQEKNGARPPVLTDLRLLAAKV